MTPRGIRLENPGNIRRGPTAWVGESTLQDDPDFLRFDKPEYGLRALMKILITYQSKDEVEHVQGMISRWAPPEENDTVSYIADCCARVGINQDDFLNLSIPQSLVRMAQAIVHHENGACPDPTLPNWYDETIYEEAVAMVLPQTKTANLKEKTMTDNAPEVLAQEVLATVKNDVLTGALPALNLFFNNIKAAPTLLNVKLQSVALYGNLVASLAMDEPKVITDIATLVQVAVNTAITKQVTPVGGTQAGATAGA